MQQVVLIFTEGGYDFRLPLLKNGNLRLACGLDVENAKFQSDMKEAHILFQRMSFATKHKKNGEEKKSNSQVHI